MQAQPFLSFDGRCEEAVEFYRSAIGAEVTTRMRFKDSPDPHEHSMIPPGAGERLRPADVVVVRDVDPRRDQDVADRNF